MILQIANEPFININLDKDPLPSVCPEVMTTLQCLPYFARFSREVKGGLFFYVKGAKGHISLTPGNKKNLQGFRHLPIPLKEED